MAEMSMVEKVAEAMEKASFGYSMSLIRLVDGVSTYSLKYSDGEYLEFSSTDEVYEHVAAKKRRTQARAAIKAMRNLSPELKSAGAVAFFSPMPTTHEEENERAASIFRRVIDAALSEEVAG